MTSCWFQSGIGLIYLMLHLTLHGLNLIKRSTDFNYFYFRFTSDVDLWTSTTSWFSTRLILQLLNSSLRSYNNPSRRMEVWSPTTVQRLTLIRNLFVFEGTHHWAETNSTRFKICYRPQMKLAKVMFLDLSVSHSVHRGVSGPTPSGEVGGSGRGVSRPTTKGGGWGSGGGARSTPRGRLGVLAWGCPGPHQWGGSKHPPSILLECILVHE